MKKIRAILENLAFFILCIVVILFLGQFKIPSDSMTACTIFGVKGPIKPCFICIMASLFMLLSL